MSLEIWGYILGGATIFALIVGIFSVWNGRATRSLLERLISSEGEATRQLIEKIDQRAEERHKEVSGLIARKV